MRHRHRRRPHRPFVAAPPVTHPPNPFPTTTLGGHTALSFATVHTITGCLVRADARAEHATGPDTATLLVIRERPVARRGCSVLRQVSVAAYPLADADLTHGLPAALHALADTPATTPPGRGSHPDPSTGAGIVAHRMPPLSGGPGRLLAYAVLYPDPIPGPHALGTPRRIDAVDTDARVYQLTRHPGDPCPVVIVCDHPAPGDAPATVTGLTALLAATGSCAPAVRP